jgi:hypothetical protein
LAWDHIRKSNTQLRKIKTTILNPSCVFHPFEGAQSDSPLLTLNPELEPQMNADHQGVATIQDVTWRIGSSFFQASVKPVFFSVHLWFILQAN